MLPPDSLVVDEESSDSLGKRRIPLRLNRKKRVRAKPITAPINRLRSSLDKTLSCLSVLFLLHANLIIYTPLKKPAAWWIVTLFLQLQKIASVDQNERRFDNLHLPAADCTIIISLGSAARTKLLIESSSSVYALVRDDYQSPIPQRLSR